MEKEFRIRTPKEMVRKAIINIPLFYLIAVALAIMSWPQPIHYGQANIGIAGVKIYAE